MKEISTGVFSSGISRSVGSTRSRVKEKEAAVCSQGEVEEDKCADRDPSKGKRPEFLAPTQPHEPLLPSDPTIPSDFLCQLISPPDPGRDYPVGYSSTIYRQPLLS